VISALVARRRLASPVILIAIGIAWTLAVVAQATGREHALHHDALTHSTLPLWAALLVFLVAWQAMIIAMMIPSSLPLVGVFNRAAAAQPRPELVKAAFFGGYAVVWSAFGAIAFLGDIGIHRLVHASPWLQQRPWVIAGGTLFIAGLFQFSDLKDACLTECRHPGPFFMSRYRRGPAAAFKMGRDHGLFCLGCCWALMLVGFGAGVANLWWMAALTAIMVYEKTGRDGDRGVVPIGVGLIALGALVLAHPSWLPPGFFGAA
jgi:predicted metal-binding membrane protein